MLNIGLLLDTYKSLLEDIGKRLVDLGLPLSLGDWGGRGGGDGGGWPDFLFLSLNPEGVLAFGDSNLNENNKVSRFLPTL